MKEVFHPALSRETNILSKSVASKLFGPVGPTEAEKAANDLASAGVS